MRGFAAKAKVAGTLAFTGRFGLSGDMDLRLTAGAALLALGLGACDGARQPTPSPEGPQANAVAERPALPAAEPPLLREDLLVAVARARSAFAAGVDDSAQQRLLDGRQVELRLRFGCSSGPFASSGSEGFSVGFDGETRTLRIAAAPNVARDDPLVSALFGKDIEAVEGFWIRRPWLLSAACPIASTSAAPKLGTNPPASGAVAGTTEVPDAAPAPVSVTGGRVGIIQYFTDADSRTRRREDRAYQATVTVHEDEQPSAAGYDLVLTGRLRRTPGGEVIACSGRSAEAAPDCLISAVFDRVWIERADNAAVIAEWGGG